MSVVPLAEKETNLVLGERLGTLVGVVKPESSPLVARVWNSFASLVQIEQDKGESGVLTKEKKAVECRLHQEMMKTTELQKETHR